MPRMIQFDDAKHGSFNALTITATVGIFPVRANKIVSDIITMDIAGNRAIQSWTGVYVHTELVQSADTTAAQVGIGLFPSHDGTDVDQEPISLANVGTSYAQETPAFLPNYAMQMRHTGTSGAVVLQVTFAFWIPGIPYFRLEAWKDVGATVTFLSQNTVIRRMVEVDG